MCKNKNIVKAVENVIKNIIDNQQKLKVYKV